MDGKSNKSIFTPSSAPSPPPPPPRKSSFPDVINSVSQRVPNHGYGAGIEDGGNWGNGVGGGVGGERGGGRGGRKVTGVRKDAGLEIRSIGLLKESLDFGVRNSDLLTVALL